MAPHDNSKSTRTSAAAVPPGAHQAVAAAATTSAAICAKWGHCGACWMKQGIAFGAVGVAVSCTLGRVHWRKVGKLVLLLAWILWAFADAEAGHLDRGSCAFDA